MSNLARTIRILSLVMAGMISLVMGLLLAERIIRPGIIEGFGTAALLGLVMLFILPALTFLALRHDRDEAIRLTGLRSYNETNRTDQPAPAAQQLAEDLQLPSLARRKIRHTAHARPPVITAGRTAEGPSGNKGTGERVPESEHIG